MPLLSIAIVVVSNLTTLVRQLYLNITVVLVEKVSVQVVLNGECLFLGEIGALILCGCVRIAIVSHLNIPIKRIPFQARRLVF
uniref:Putative product n=1 Tax=Xenopsylla cheopis TaxID=163159 RepID=A0A6M2DZM9_XENCH